MTMLNLLEDAASAPGHVRFISDDVETITFSELWQQSEAAAAWLAGRRDPGDSVAVVLTTAPAVLAVALGAWRSGLRLVSVPQPARGMPLEEYREQVNVMCRAVDCELLIIEGRYLPFIPSDLEVATEAAESCLAGGTTRHLDATHASFVQFTSGTTSVPKGVQLSLDAIAANVRALLEVLRPEPDDSLVSWLPLSHDMGFVGTFLTGVAALSRRWALGGQVNLIRPERFLSNPSIWLKACSEFGATFTAAPNFALELAARVLAGRHTYELNRLRVCITGAEMVRADSLRRFCAAAEPHGLDERCICPAYGLAEATLAVTMVPSEQLWRSVRVDADSLSAGRWVEADAVAEDSDRLVELVSCGQELPSADIRIGTENGVGPIEISGASLFDGYVNDSSAELEDGWLRTGDLGFISARDLFVTGRSDDLIIVAGRNVYALDIERRALVEGVVRSGNVVALSDEDGRYAVVAELVRHLDASVDLEAAAKGIRQQLVHRFGVGPTSVTFVPARALPKTPSGKVQRHKVRQAVRTESMPIERLVRFSRVR